MGYYMDLSKISLEQFEKRLKRQHLLPSQKILGIDLEKKFDYLRSNGLFSMSDIQEALKTKIRLNRFAVLSGIDFEYLVVLRREVNSYLPKFRSLDEFPNISKETIIKLKQIKIRNTFNLFEYILTESSRKKLSRNNSISYDEIMDLTKLTDLVRIKWVGPVFARLLIESNYGSVEKISSADYKTLFEDIKQINIENKYYRGQFGLSDSKLLVTISKDVSLDIKY